MPRAKKKTPKAKTAPAQALPVLRKGPPTNLRPAGPMEDRRLRRRRTRQAEEQAALEEDA